MINLTKKRLYHTILEVQDSLHILIQYARVELIKHLPWNKYEPLPSEDNILQTYEQFETDENCSLSLKVSFECLKHIQELNNRGIKEPIQKIKKNRLHMFDL
jgi:hypothetical protein